MLPALSTIFSVRFFERLRPPTTLEIIGREERMKRAEEIMWPEGIQYMSIRNGDVTLRPETEAEKEGYRFRSTADYLAKPPLSANCVFMSDERLRLDEADAADLREALHQAGHFLIFTNLDNNGIDTQSIYINVDNAFIAYASSPTGTVVLSKDYNQAKDRHTASLSLPEPYFLTALAQQGYAYRHIEEMGYTIHTQKPR